MTPILFTGENGTLQVIDSHFHNNKAAKAGGAIQANSNAKVILANTTISRCSAPSGGGIVAWHGADVTITQQSIIDGCSAGSVSDTHCLSY